MYSQATFNKSVMLFFSVKTYFSNTTIKILTTNMIFSHLFWNYRWMNYSYGFLRTVTTQFSLQFFYSFLIFMNVLIIQFYLLDSLWTQYSCFSLIKAGSIILIRWYNILPYSCWVTFPHLKAKATKRTFHLALDYKNSYELNIFQPCIIFQADEFQ